MYCRVAFVFIVALCSCQSGPDGIGPAAGEWVALFDGRTTAGWRGFKQDSFPKSGWSIVDGCLHLAEGGGGDIMTTGVYEDFELELEWRVGPGSNSGIIYRVSEAGAATWATGPEYQILDDGQHAPDSDTSAGALYDMVGPENKHLRAVGEFNQTRIVVCGNRIEHWLNGERVLSTTMHTADWYRRVAASKWKDHPLFATAGRGHIALQDHGDEVWYRSIRLRPLSVVELRGGDTVELFNGRDLGGWTHHLNALERGGEQVAVDPGEVWRVEDGVLVCTGLPAGYLRTIDRYQDFVLELDWRWGRPDEAGLKNSGVLLRMSGPDKVWPRCIEGQLMSGRAGDFWNMGDPTLTTDPARAGANPRNGRHSQVAEKPEGEWNHYRILVLDGKVMLEINGEVINNAWRCEILPGHIGLQSEGAEIHFKNIRLTTL